MPNDDCIKRSDVLEALMSCRSLTPVAKLAAVNLIMQIPAVDAEPVVHGCWIERGNGRNPYCSECCGIGDRSPFCKHCGAKMDKEEDDE